MRFHKGGAGYDDVICYTPDKYICDECDVIILVDDICKFTYDPYKDKNEYKVTMKYYHKRCFNKDQYTIRRSTWLR
jgi:hypothetical protein